MRRAALSNVARSGTQSLRYIITCTVCIKIYMTRKRATTRWNRAKRTQKWRSLFPIGRDEQAAEFGRCVGAARKLEGRAFAEIARINVGVGAGGADDAFGPIVGEAEVSLLDRQGRKTCRRPGRRRELGPLHGVDRPGDDRRPLRVACRSRGEQRESRQRLGQDAAPRGACSSSRATARSPLSPTCASQIRAL